MNERGRTNPPRRSSSSDAPIDAKNLRVFDAETAAEMDTKLAIFVDSVIAEQRGRNLELNVAVRLDAVTRLTAPIMASLIAALRRLRETGGDLIIVTRRADLRASLDVTGLYKVFRLVEALEAVDALHSS